MTEPHLSTKIGIDAEELAGKRFPYQEDISLLDDIDLDALTPGDDLNWLEDITCCRRTACRRCSTAYSNSFLKIYFPIPEGREDEIARKVLMKHLVTGNSYGIQLKAKHTKFPQPELGPWVEGSPTVGTDYQAPRARGLGEARRPLTGTRKDTWSPGAQHIIRSVPPTPCVELGRRHVSDVERLRPRGPGMSADGRGPW